MFVVSGIPTVTSQTRPSGIKAERRDRQYGTFRSPRRIAGTSLRTKWSNKYETFPKRVVWSERERETNPIVLARFASTASRGHFSEQRVRNKPAMADYCNREYETNRTMDLTGLIEAHPNTPQIRNRGPRTIVSRPAGSPAHINKHICPVLSAPAIHRPQNVSCSLFARWLPTGS